MDLSNYNPAKNYTSNGILTTKRKEHESKKSNRWRKFFNAHKKVIIYSYLLFCVLISIYPFIWGIIAPFNHYSKMSQLGINPFPASGEWTTENYAFLFSDGMLSSKIGIWMRNSFVYSGLNATLNVIFDFLGGYALARISFRMRKPFVWYLLAGTMIPAQVTQMPQLIILIKMGVIGRNASDAAFFAGIIFTGMTSATWVFMARQYFLNIGVSAEEAGAIDGLSTFGVFWRISLKQVVPLMALVWTLVFMASWNNFVMFNLWAGGDQNRMNMVAGMQEIAAMAGTNRDIIFGSMIALTSTNLVILPVIGVYFISLFFQKTDKVEGEK